MTTDRHGTGVRRHSRAFGMAVHAGSVHRHLPFYVIGLVGGAFAAKPIGPALASGHAIPVTSDLIWTMVWYGLGSILILAILAALRLAFFSANKLFAADGDWGTVSETNKTTTTTDDAEAQA